MKLVQSIFILSTLMISAIGCSQKDGGSASAGSPGENNASQIQASSGCQKSSALAMVEFIEHYERIRRRYNPQITRHDLLRIAAEMGENARSEEELTDAEIDACCHDQRFSGTRFCQENPS